MTLEQALETYVIGATDKILKMSKYAGRDTEYPDSVWLGHKKYHTTLLLATYNRTYKQIAETAYKELMQLDNMVDLFSLSTEDRKLLYKAIHNTHYRRRYK